MACDAPVRQCFDWHVLPRLGKVVHRKRDDGSDDPFSVRALCPAHDDHERSLSVSIGDKGRVIWQCFAGCPAVRVRAALIAENVDAGCLILTGKEREDLLNLLGAILTTDTPDHGAIRLRALAALEGYAVLPRGGELDHLAERARVNRATAYRARKSAPGVKTANTSSYSPGENVVKRRRPGPP